jgi:hypothetical protein
MGLCGPVSLPDGLRGVCVIAALAMKVPISIAGAVLPLEALLASPSFDQSAVDGEVLVRQIALGLFQHLLKESRCDISVQLRNAFLGAQIPEYTGVAGCLVLTLRRRLKYSLRDCSERFQQATRLGL